MMQQQQLQQSKIFVEAVYDEDANAQFRAYMEDGCVIYQDIQNETNEPSILFGVFDGHGGEQCMLFLKENLRKEFVKLHKNHNDNINQLLYDLFYNLNEQLKMDKKNNSQEAGSTGTIGYLRKEKNNNQSEQSVLYIANVGDSRAVLFEENVAIRLSYDDKATDEEEQSRIYKDGGNIFQGRVNGLLAITRAFGDHNLTDAGVICRPHLTRTIIRQAHKYLVIASDGLWDMIDDRQALDFVFTQKSLKEKAKELITVAKEQGSKDNIIVGIIQIQP